MMIRESDLPGVGKKFEIDLGDEEMIVVIHNTGKREVFRRDDPDADSERVFAFDDDPARPERRSRSAAPLLGLLLSDLINGRSRPAAPRF